MSEGKDIELVLIQSTIQRLVTTLAANVPQHLEVVQSNCTNYPHKMQNTVLWISVVTLFFVLLFVGLHIFSSKEVTWKYGALVSMEITWSRIHIFKWSDIDPIQIAVSYRDSYFYDVRPGVVSYINCTYDAGAYLVPLLDAVSLYLSLYSVELSEVPVFILGVPYLSTLDETKMEAIFNSIRAEMKTFDFLFQDDWIELITESQQATYDWITIQQIVLTQFYYFNHNSTPDYYINYNFPVSDYDTESYNSYLYNYFTTKEILDWSSYQRNTIGAITIEYDHMDVSFLPNPQSIGSEFDKRLFVSLSTIPEAQFLNPSVPQNISIYAKQYKQLGYLFARSSYFTLLLDQTTDYVDNVITDPCSNPGSSISSSIYGIDFLFVGNFLLTQCTFLIQQLLDQSDICKYSQCGFGGVYQPKIEGNIFFGSGMLSKLMNNVLQLPPYPKLYEIRDNANYFCSIEFTDILDKLFPINTVDLMHSCFASHFTYHLLSGMGFEDNSQQIYFVEDQFNHAASWTYGAMTYQTSVHDL